MKLDKAADAAADPDLIRAEARQAANAVIDKAQLQGEELLASAKRRARVLRKDARREAKELVAQAEVDVGGLVSRWRAAYQAALKAGWTVEQLEEAGQQAPPAARRGRHRRAPGGTTDETGSAGTESGAQAAAEVPPERPT